MTYENIVPATFISRQNRFVALCEYEGAQVVCHVKNTGRCKELLLPGARVFLQKAPEITGRKTLFDLISVVNDGSVINIDSQAPNRVFYEWALSGGFLPDITELSPERVFESSRFDFFIRTESKSIYVEVKGVTLRNKGIALFPDAPTDRGVKHIRELISAKNQGFDAYLFFVIQMDGVSCLMPNTQTHPEFAAAMKQAEAAGVKILARDCAVAPDSLTLRDPVPCIIK